MTVSFMLAEALNLTFLSSIEHVDSEVSTNAAKVKKGNIFYED
jgi:hypothetical protein